jgi:hypothetical protein
MLRGKAYELRWRLGGLHEPTPPDGFAPVMGGTGSNIPPEPRDLRTSKEIEDLERAADYFEKESVLYNLMPRPQ